MNDKNEKVFVNGLWVREKKFDDSRSIINLSVLVDKFQEELKKYKKKDGFVNIILSPRREPDSKSSHYAYLDTWTPPGKEDTKQKVKDSEVDI